jgi:hypothetical protein
VPAQTGEEGLSLFAARHIAAIDQDVGILGQGIAPRIQAGSVVAQRRSIESTGAQFEIAGCAVGNDMHGGDVSAQPEDIADLGNAVAFGVEQDDLGLALCGFVLDRCDQRLPVIDAGIDDDQFGAAFGSVDVRQSGAGFRLIQWPNFSAGSHAGVERQSGRQIAGVQDARFQLLDDGTHGRPEKQIHTGATQGQPCRRPHAYSPASITGQCVLPGSAICPAPGPTTMSSGCRPDTLKNDISAENVRVRAACRWPRP